MFPPGRRRVRGFWKKKRHTRRSNERVPFRSKSNRIAINGRRALPAVVCTEDRRRYDIWRRNRRKNREQQVQCSAPGSGLDRIRNMERNSLCDLVFGRVVGKMKMPEPAKTG
jgi:hypothetical protein